MLTTLKAQLDLPTNPVEPRILKMARGYADFSDQNANVTGAIDANDETGWGIWPAVGKPHQAMFDFAEPVALPDGTVLRVTLEFKSGLSQHQLGRFRLSTSEDPAVLAEHRFLAMKLTEPWARLAAAYRSVGDQQALDKLLERHRAAAVGIGDLCAADQDWERAITEYRKLITDRPADGNLLAKLARAYQSAGRTREAVSYLVTASAANPADTVLSLKVAALQAWFGQEKELADTRQRILAFVRDTNDASTVERAVRACSILPPIDKAELERALTLGRKWAKLVSVEFAEWSLMALGMAEYRSGNDASADLALLAAANVDPINPYVTGTSAFYRAMSLFQQGKKDEARKLAIAAAAKMRPLPRDENNPLANFTAQVGGGDSQEYLIMWLAYKEAKALIKFDAPPAAPTTPDGK
jgi:tetratricopeptide (TPR) repeat protein